MESKKCASCKSPENTGRILKRFVMIDGHCLLLCESCYIKWMTNQSKE